MLSSISFDDRVALAVDKICAANSALSKDDLTSASKSFFQKLLIAAQYVVTEKYSGHITLITAEKSFSQTNTMDEDYGLKQVKFNTTS